MGREDEAMDRRREEMVSGNWIDLAGQPMVRVASASRHCHPATNRRPVIYPTVLY